MKKVAKGPGATMRAPVERRKMPAEAPRYEPPRMSSISEADMLRELAPVHGEISPTDGDRTL